MKICLKCEKPIDEDGEDTYVMILTKKKNRILDFECFHLDCLQERLDSVVLGEVKEKMNKCSVCGKELRFWSSYIKGGAYFCKECWQKKEEKLEGAREEKERGMAEKSKKRDESITESQKTL
jgi:hypothetical protein